MRLRFRFLWTWISAQGLSGTGSGTAGRPIRGERQPSGRNASNLAPSKFDRFEQHIDVVETRIDAKTGAGRGGNSQQVVQRHGAMVPVPDGDTLAIDEVRQVLRV